MTDPNYKDNLVKFFKSKGFKYKDIDAWMERNQIDKKINDAKAENYADLYYRALASGNPITASAVLSQLAPINPQMASAIMATTPSYKDAWNVNNARENAITAYQMKQKADEANYKRQLARDRQQFEEKMKLAAYNSGLKLEEYKQRLGFEYNTIAQLQGTEAANQWLVDTLNKGSKGGSSKGSSENKVSKETVELERSMKQLGDEAKYAIDNNAGDDSGGDATKAFTDKVYELAEKGKLDDTHKDFYTNMAYILEGYRNLKQGNPNSARENFSYLSDEFKNSNQGKAIIEGYGLQAYM